MSNPKKSNDPYKNGSKCPYCNGNTVFVDSKEVYGKSYGFIYICRPCKSYVGVHKGTKIALGRLADQPLRKAKIEAHKYFNHIFETGSLTRKESYDWLSGIMGLPKHETHIGFFDIQQCKDVVLYSKQFLNDMRRLDLDFGVEPKAPYFETVQTTS